MVVVDIVVVYDVVGVIMLSLQGEELSTVLWYRDENAEPIYTFDARKTNLL